MPQQHGLLVSRGRPDAGDMDFLLQEKPLFRNQDFLHDRNDRGVTFLPDAWHVIDDAADDDPLHVGMILGKDLVNKLLAQMGLG